jgi:hypothetical protein
MARDGSYCRHLEDEDGIVEDGDLEDVAPEYLEGHEVDDFDLMRNGKFMPPLIEADSAFYVLQLDHLGAAVVHLEDVCPGDGAKVQMEAGWDGEHFQARRQHHFSKVGWSDVIMEMPNLNRPSLGLLPALPFLASLEQPSPKSLPSSSSSTAKRRSNLNEHK